VPRLRADAKTKLIADVPLFAGLSKRELAQVAAIADEIDVRAGRVLIREGDPGREFFVLLEGEAELSQRGRVLKKRTPGDFFGEMALVSKRPRNATVTTTTPARALVISERDFRSLLQRSPTIALKVLTAFVERLPPEEE